MLLKRGTGRDEWKMGAKQRMGNELTRARGLEFKLGFCPSPLPILVTSAQKGPFLRDQRRKYQAGKKSRAHFAL